MPSLPLPLPLPTDSAPSFLFSKWGYPLSASTTQSVIPSEARDLQISDNAGDSSLRPECQETHVGVLALSGDPPLTNCQGDFDEVDRRVGSKRGVQRDMVNALSVIRYVARRVDYGVTATA